MIGSNSSARLSASVAATLVVLMLHSTAAIADSIANCGIAPPIPAAPSSAKVVPHASGVDDTASIQRTLDGMKAGESLIFPPDTYNISKHLVVHTPEVTLYGHGATIHATNATDGALLIQGDSVAVYGFKLEQDSASRQGAPWSGGISVYDDRGGGRRQVHGVIIQNNTINNSAAAGIFLYKADHFTIAGNTVWRSWADGIHMTSGSTNGRVIHNTVSQTGDDMIAVVSYAGSRTPGPAAVRYANWALLEAGLDRNIYIRGNQVADQYWGRGISVVGGSDVTIDTNSISKVPGGSGIYLARESSYMTFGDHNILVRDNTLSDIQTSAASYDPVGKDAKPNGTGAIEVASQMASDERSDPTYRAAFSISDITIASNKVQSARFAGIRMGAGTTASSVVKAANGTSSTVTWAPGPVSNVVVQDNDLNGVQSNGVVANYPGLDLAEISCRNNQVNGEKWPAQCSSSSAGGAATPTAAVGATLECNSSGTLTPAIPPNSSAPVS